jgi:hypothetical protein
MAKKLTETQRLVDELMLAMLEYVSESERPDKWEP